MGSISDARKRVLLRRYGSQRLNTNQKPGAMMRPKGASGPGGPKGTSRLSGTKPKNAFAVLRRLFSYVGRDKMKIPFVFVCVLLSALAGLGGSYILRPIIKSLII